MKIEEMIKRLEAIAKEHPGCEVEYEDDTRYFPVSVVAYAESDNTVCVGSAAFEVLKQ